jgi:hypothetical protein
VLLAFTRLTQDERERSGYETEVRSSAVHPFILRLTQDEREGEALGLTQDEPFE